MAGWYHDAGDWDAYYTHQRIPILLMLTWEYFPERFADGDLDLPESGNGIPDLLDEASWLIKFNYRLRKELMEKQFSSGGVGGARICPDVYNSVEGNAQSDKPSWQDYRHYVVTQADAFMTYLYAGQAAQFALILKQLGKDPHRFPVEMLDAVSFDEMTRDTVDWEKEAREAYAWASAANNQPESNKNYGAPLEVYRMYAAVNLYRLTDKDAYHQAALPELDRFRNYPDLSEDHRWGFYSYLLADNSGRDTVLQDYLVSVARLAAETKGTIAAEKRACRWGGDYYMPMLVGQATTPWVFECIMAYGLTGETGYLDVVHTTADYFLGTNPLHTTWTTRLGPRPAEVGFHLDSRYNNNWELYPGFIPYGPWSMAFGYTPYTWTIDGVLFEGGHGPWNKDWANFSQYPFMEQWPGHERWNSNIHAPLSTENTVHQNAVYGMLTYGFVNNRQNKNATSERSVGEIILNATQFTLDGPTDVDTLVATLDIPDPSIGALRWRSSNDSIAYVDQSGRIKAVSKGTCTVTVETLDGSVSATAGVTCDWTYVEVESVVLDPQGLSMVEGQFDTVDVFFYPINASDKQVVWYSEDPSLATVDAHGRVEALSPGITLIVATALNGTAKDTCVVVVHEAQLYIPVSDIRITGDSLLNMEKDSVLQLHAEISPAEATDQAVNWSVSDSQVLEVDASGALTALEKGTAYVRAAAAADPTISDSVLVQVVITGTGPGKAAFLGGSHQLSVYPNPARSRLVVRSVAPMDRVTLFRITGESVLEEQAEGRSEFLLVCPDLEPGLYFLRARMTDQSHASVKVVVE